LSGAGIQLAREKQILILPVTLDECHAKLCRRAAAETDDTEARELFKSLVRTEQRDEIELKKIKAMDYF
jgi:hypothetical protein